MSSIFKCDYCGKTYSSKSNLNTHIKNAKFCLEKRGLLEKNEEPKVPVKKLFPCEGCDKVFSSQQMKNLHQAKCVQFNVNMCEEKCKEKISSYQEKYDEIKKRCEELERKLFSLTEKAISKPTSTIVHNNKNNTTTTNTIDNRIQSVSELLPHDPQRSIGLVHNLKEEHVKKGSRGYVEYAMEFPLNKRIFCSDLSRKKLIWKDENNNFVNDPEGMKLLQAFFGPIKDVSNDYIQGLLDGLAEEIKDMMDKGLTVNDPPCAEKKREYDFLKANQSDILRILKGEKTPLGFEFKRDLSYVAYVPKA